MTGETDASEQHGHTGPPVPNWLKERLDRIEDLIAPEVKATLKAGQATVKAGQHLVVPAWRRVTRGEPRWQVLIAIAAVVVLQFVVPPHLSFGPRFVFPGVEAAIGLGLLVANPGRIEHERPKLRVVSLILIAIMSLANAASAVRLIDGLLRGTEGSDAAKLLVNGGAIWLTNVLVFALWYWELDRGGPVSRALALKQHPDFLFAQMATPDLADPDWEPEFPDYFYLSFTNATAFSPTDTLPLTRWAKMLMLVQSAVSLGTVALVIARAVNILK